MAVRTQSCRAAGAYPAVAAVARVAAAWATALSLLLAPLVARAEPAGTSVHIVAADETLSQIADAAGTDSATLAKLNNLDSLDFLVIGQALNLPSSATSPGPSSSSASTAGGTTRTVTVADGDTLWSIAQQHSTTVAAVMDANTLDDPDHLTLGAQLTLPATAAPSPIAATTSAAPASESASTGGVAAAAGAPTAAAAGPQTAAPAAQLTAPTQTGAKRSLLVPYTVQAGETLTHIAHQFEVRADAIAQASGLEDPNRLSIGTVLKIPLPGHEHEVKAGETLRDIALQEKVDLGSLIDFNSLADPELIRVGQVLMVPTPGSNLAAAWPATARPGAVSSGPAPTTPAALTTSPAQPAASPAAASARPAAASASPAQPASSPAAASASSSAASGQAVAAAPSASPVGNAVVAVARSGAAKPAAPVAVVAAPKVLPTDDLARASIKLLGSPYVWGGSSPSGFDCSGLVWYAARQVGKSISRGLLGEYNSGSHPPREELKPGDLVFFQNTYTAGLSHNGIYIGNNQFVNAADEAAGVTISSLASPYWTSHWFGATRLP